eukprot:CAMPEP_0113653532 /NCGR_PEP_ID=MMETSP0017_2-20120614/28635_1 /TAXON_ID=2856 /ORGANISM="Cylindrotheca closterium" /LENGTH=527 /DNA_ID=CAMNT_0000566543 /DNA_START=66 /DNA_END=1649 /DNA_ORIENTATION=+ /assembly_acc=CAM_ASM_000147
MTATRTTTQTCRIESSLVLSFLLLLALVTHTESYITFKTYIPPIRQRQWLTQLTGDICDSPTGSRLIDSAPEVLRGWSMSKDATVENAMAVESLFKRLVDESKAGERNVNPTTLDYNIILNLWVKSRGGVLASERCEQILTTMQKLHHDTNDFSIQPNLETFKSVLLSWKNSGVPFAAIRAQRVLEWMIQLYEAGENDVLPDSDCFDIVLQIWSRSDDPKAAYKAEQLLLTQDKLSQIVQSHKLRPTTMSFNAVLNAWAKKVSPEASHKYKKLVTLLSLMEHLYFEMGNTRVEPDRCTVFCALAKGCSFETATRADKILRSIEYHYKNHEISWQPDAILFNAVIASWAHSDVTGAYRKAQSILDRQLNLYKAGCQECRPDVIGFTSVLSSCASEPKKSEKAKAFNVALSNIQTLEKNPAFGKANHVTYGTMLKACARLLPAGSPERTKWTRHFFQKSCEAGMVGGMVLGRLREAASPEEYKELMQGYSKNFLPKEWTVNVQEKSGRRQPPSQKTLNTNSNSSNGAKR